MKRSLKYWPYLTLLILCVILSAGYLTRAQEEEQGPESQAQELAERVRSSVDADGQTKGTRGGSVRSAVVNFAELARRESLRAVPLSEPKAIRAGTWPSAPARIKERDQRAGNYAREPEAPQVASPAPAQVSKRLKITARVFRPTRTEPSALTT